MLQLLTKFVFTLHFFNTVEGLSLDFLYRFSANSLEELHMFFGWFADFFLGLTFWEDWLCSLLQNVLFKSRQCSNINFQHISLFCLQYKFAKRALKLNKILFWMILFVPGSLHWSKPSKDPLQIVVDVINSRVVQQVETEGYLQDCCQTLAQHDILKNNSGTNTHWDDKTLIIDILSMLTFRMWR